MSEKSRKNFSSQFKAKVAMDAIRGIKTVNEIAQEFGVHPTQVGHWKKVLQEQAAGIFDTVRGPKPADPSSSPEHLYSEIGRLKMELDWLKKIRDEPVKDRRQWISPSSPLPLYRQCELAGVTRSTIYAQHLPTKPDEQELTLLGEIDAEYTQHPFYGSRKLFQVKKDTQAYMDGSFFS